MRITETQLRSIIKEEYLRSTPTRPGMLMTEARANALAEEMLEEGLFDAIKAGWSALKGGAGAAADKMGEKAGAALAPAIKAVQSVAAAAKNAANSVSTAIGEIKDEALKKAAEAAKESFRQSLESSMKTALANGLKNLTGAGMDEKEAKTLAATIMGAELAALTGSGNVE